MSTGSAQQQYAVEETYHGLGGGDRERERSIDSQPREVTREVTKEVPVPYEVIKEVIKEVRFDQRMV